MTHLENAVDVAAPDVPDAMRAPTCEYLDIVQQRLPRQWRTSVGPVWTQAMAPVAPTRTQGWKIHLSACLEDAARLLEIATVVCTENHTEFKFASDTYRHHKLLTKNIGRQTGGKFITIYPPDDDVFGLLLEALYQATTDINGPYILSDRQYKDSSTVFYRYGGFHLFQDVNVFGEPRSLIFNENFELIEDRRSASVHVPPFVVDKKWGQAEASIVDDMDDDVKKAGPPILNGRFQMRAALKQSNVGGIYLARDLIEDRDVVIREARPMTDPDLHDQDAVLRLNREYDILMQIKHKRIGPAPVAKFEEWTHTFLAVEHVSGKNLRQVIASRSSLLHAQSSRATQAQWFRTCVRVARDLIDKIESMHAEGIVFGDVSPNNIIVNDQTESITLIDFETAFRPETDLGHNAFTPGFGFDERKLRGVATFNDDVIGVGAVMLAMLMPSSCNLGLIAGFSDDALAMLEADIGLPEAYSACVRVLLEAKEGALSRARDLIAGVGADAIHAIPAAPAASALARLPAMREALTDYIEDVVRVDDPFRLTPADPGYLDNPIGFDHGAAGVVFGLHRLRKGVPAAVERWLSDAADRECETPGLMNGLAGLCWTFAHLGRPARARALLDRTHRHKLLFADASLGYGLSGIGLCHLLLWRQTRELDQLQAALDIVDTLHATAIETAAGVRWRTAHLGEQDPHHVGLHGGSSGVALFLLYAYCASGRDDCLTLASRALAHDLSFEAAIGGSVGFPRMSHGDEGRVLYPYMEYGTAGIAGVALRLYHVTRRAPLRAFAERVTGGIAQRYTVSAGLGGGMAGLGNYLLDAAKFLAQPALRELAERCATSLLIFRVPRNRGTATPARLGGSASASYIDGAVGVALFLDRVLSDGEAFHLSLDELLDEGRARHARQAAPSDLLEPAA